MLHFAVESGYDRFTPVIDFFAEASHVGKLAEAGKPEEIRDFVKKTGSNFRMREKKIAFEYKNHRRILHDFLCRPAGKKEKMQNLQIGGGAGIRTRVRKPLAGTATGLAPSVSRPGLVRSDNSRPCSVLS